MNVEYEFIQFWCLKASFYKIEFIFLCWHLLLWHANMCMVCECAFFVFVFCCHCLWILNHLWYSTTQSTTIIIMLLLLYCLAQFNAISHIDRQNVKANRESLLIVSVKRQIVRQRIPAIWSVLCSALHLSNETHFPLKSRWLRNRIINENQVISHHNFFSFSLSFSN